MFSQKKDYEVALVGAFRREKDKDIALQALTAENQAAVQLVYLLTSGNIFNVREMFWRQRLHAWDAHRLRQKYVCVCVYFAFFHIHSVHAVRV